jgi:hypothetical protein
MKYVVAAVGSLIIFIGAGLVSGLVLVMICPISWRETYINLGLFSANIPSLIAFAIASLAATHSFRASLRLKTGKNKSA